MPTEIFAPRRSPILSTRQGDPLALPEFFTPPKAGEVPLGLGSGMTDTQPAKFVAPTPPAQRPGSVRPPTQGESALAVAVPAYQNAVQAPATTDVVSGAVSTLASGAAGAAQGALAGAAIGAAGGHIGMAGGAAIGGLTALVTTGLSAWIGNRAARAERDRQNALARDARRRADEQTAYNRRIAERDRNDNLEQVAYNRRLAAQERNRAQFEKVGSTLLGSIKTNQSLNDRWAKLGFRQ
jgi:hypothetical protein